MLVGQPRVDHQNSCVKIGFSIKDWLYVIERVHFIVLNRARGFSPEDSSILSLLGFNEKVGGSRTAPSCIPIKGSKDLGLFSIR